MRTAVMFARVPAGMRQYVSLTGSKTRPPVAATMTQQRQQQLLPASAVAGCCTSPGWHWLKLQLNAPIWHQSHQLRGSHMHDRTWSGRLHTSRKDTEALNESVLTARQHARHSSLCQCLRGCTSKHTLTELPQASGAVCSLPGVLLQ